MVKTYEKGFPALCILAVLTLLFLSCGYTCCGNRNAARFVLHPYHLPGKSADGIVELEISITDSNGRVETGSMGSRLATTPIQYGSSYKVTGSFDGKDRVYVTGYFSNGSQKTIIDTNI